ncbi:MAG TPA: sigma-70 family RNA polymerase sigma factor [Steroidobacteraceae bacterium]|nr:sigma-70 family RNA polymerase sigma factor [Steroidobacteraceae bacterium]
MNDERISGQPLSASGATANAGVPNGQSAFVSSASVHTAGSPSTPLTQSDVAALIERNYVGLRLLVTRRCRDAQIAADLLNEAVCTTWEKWQTGKIGRPEQIAGYVLQVTMNLLRNHRRAIGERPERRADPAAIQDLPGDAEPSDETIELQIAARVKQVIREMSSARDRTILVRFYLDEEPKDAICRDLHLTALQFDKILHRARGRLRKLLESSGMAHGDLLSLALLL